ncbi:MAG TPA: APC family permease [Actinomycetota bacterium]|jgi:amino acid transporter|nr:APC family permease [Actinomycetota bacterium]
MAVVSEAPGLFLRKATGLVKGWSKFDAFLYSFMSVNFVTLGLFFAFSVLAFVPSGQILPALLISGVFVTFLVVTYAGLISVMPRAGGDYVWQSRVLGGGIAFVLAVTGWWFILWYWAPVYANILNVEVFQPLAAVLGLDGLTDFLAKDIGLFTVAIVTVGLAAVLVSLGMEGYARIQKFCFYLGLAGLAVIFLVMLFGSRSGFESAFNQEASNLFGTSGNAYQQTIELGQTNNAGPIVPELGFTPFFGDSLLLIPFLCFWILWPNWGATLYGEVRGASDFRRVMSGMMWGLWVTVAIAFVFVLLSAKFFGWEFFNAANLNYWATVYGFGDAAIPIWSYPPMLASFYFHNEAVQAIIVLVFGAWFLGWAGTLFLSSTRVIFAAAFDRILPEKVADVSERRHVPYWALLLMLVPSIVVSWLYVYTADFATFILDATLVIAVTFFGTSIAAMILPYRKKRLYENSPIARYKVAGIPLITITGAITALFLGFNLYHWFTNDLYAVNDSTSLWFMAAMYGLAIVIYVIAWFVRRSQGINLSAIHREIPVE